MDQEHDVKSAEALLAEERSSCLLADRGYDSDALRAILSERGTQAVIPGKKNRLQPIDYDRHIYKERNLVERFFNRIKHYRRIATRYEKTAKMFMGALTLIGILMWLKL